MKAVVLDASALFELVVDIGDATAWADDLVESAQRLIAPQGVFAELAAVLRKYYLQKRLSRDEVQEAMRNALALGIELEPFAPVAERVVSLLDNVTPYDAWYVAIAEIWDAPLATTDGRLARATGPTCEFVVPCV